MEYGLYCFNVPLLTIRTYQSTVSHTRAIVFIMIVLFYYIENVMCTALLVLRLN